MSWVAVATASYGAVQRARVAPLAPSSAPVDLQAITLRPDRAPAGHSRKRALWWALAVLSLATLAGKLAREFREPAPALGAQIEEASK